MLYTVLLFQSATIDEATRHLMMLISDQIRSDSQLQTGQHQTTAQQQQQPFTTQLQKQQPSTAQQQKQQPLTAQQQTPVQREWPGYLCLGKIVICLIIFSSASVWIIWYLSTQFIMYKLISVNLLCYAIMLILTITYSLTFNYLQFLNVIY